VQQTMAENQLVMPLTYSHFSWALKDDVSGFTIGVTGIPWLADTAVTG
jgi:hypothetical protein